MASLGKCLVLSLALATGVFSQAHPEPEIRGADIVNLHERVPSDALHSESKFQDGFFERDHWTNLLGAADFELRRRAIANSSPTDETPPPSPTSTPRISTPPVMSTPHVEQSLSILDPSLYVPSSDTTPTTSPSNPTPTTSPNNPTPTNSPSDSASTHSTSHPNPPPSTTDNEVLIPVDLPTTDAEGKSTVTRASLLAPASLTVDVPITTTDAAGKPTTTTSRSPAVALTTTDAAGRPSTFTTRASGPPRVDTFTPVVSRLVLSTSTLPDGTVKVFTSFTVVGGSAAGQATASPSPQGGQGSPLLQNGAGRGELAWGMMAIVGAMTYLLVRW